jgi:hypothetical protein
MAHHRLTDTYVATLARHLPSDTVDELADGLAATYQQYLRQGFAPDDAAAAAIAEFGSTDEIIAEFTRTAPGRRAARLLLATGPAVGVCWASGLVMAKFWTWSAPAAAVVTAAVTLFTAVGFLVVAATSSHSYHRTKLAAIGGAGMVLLDLALPAAILVSAPAFAWPMAAAIPASLIRAGLTLRSLPRIVYG